ncbi:polysaccharide deacetylase family protein [Falsibacillus pallidus]|uniref:polysaccharide deacetylase family protein n=1 Tax=Falsibacillus pallidus TaxID=493781 RepID=UPI003CCC8F11
MIFLIWAAAIILAYLILTVFSTIFIRVFSIGITKKGQIPNRIAITFDDGPDPVYTPRLLDVLKKHNVKATFFLVGEKAERYPEIVKRIHDEGHLIGLHNYKHISNWFIPPFTLRTHLKRSQDIIYSITGEKPFYYRPPWGHFNAFTLMASAGSRVIMWTSIPGDWKENVGADKLLERLVAARQSGAVITLHDSGTTFGADEHAPKNTIEALDRFLTLEDSKTYSYTTVNDVLEHSSGK